MRFCISLLLFLLVCSRTFFFASSDFLSSSPSFPNLKRNGTESGYYHLYYYEVAIISYLIHGVCCNSMPYTMSKRKRRPGNGRKRERAKQTRIVGQTLYLLHLFIFIMNFRNAFQLITVLACALATHFSRFLPSPHTQTYCEQCENCVLYLNHILRHTIFDYKRVCVYA